MRPVNKGDAPEKEYKHYQDALSDLEVRLGPYCSFCEMVIQHVPEVENREAKSAGGEELKWDNLLLACKYCNTRKGARVKKDDKEKYLWPDEDDTFHAYLYDKDLPRLNESYLDMKGQEEREKAENLFNLLKLDNFPLSPGDKDRRFKARNEARNYAQNSKAGLKKMKCFSQRRDYLEIIQSLAQASGFFSVWMEVFKDDEEVKNILINAFKGTKGEYCREYNQSST